MFLRLVEAHIELDLSVDVCRQVLRVIHLNKADSSGFVYKLLCEYLVE